MYTGTSVKLMDEVSYSLQPHDMKCLKQMNYKCYCVAGENLNQLLKKQKMF
jgi:hypothetical protein